MKQAPPHPLTRLVAISIAVTAALHWLFFAFSERIWAIRDDVPLSQITPWARWAMYERDGAEPQFLLLLLLSAPLLTAAAMWLLRRTSPVWSTRIVAACFGLGLFFLTQALPLPPLMWLTTNFPAMLAAEAGVLAAAALAWKLTLSRSGNALLAVSLFPVCFLASSLPRYDDLSCVLAPALRMRHGFPLSQIYFQYDFLPSLLALAWHRLGFDPASFPLCTAVFYYVLLVVCFLVARRMFHQKRLAGVLLVALIVVRIYAIRPDANASPQVTPLRLDLWIYLLGLALVFGLRHWSVGLAAGMLFFFSRSMGMLYLGGYALALAADFFARRATGHNDQTLGSALRETATSLLLAAVGVAAGAATFGGLVPEAVATYHHLGLGMLRIASFSSFWWIVPVFAMTAWLAFSNYQPGEKRSSAAIFAVALAVSNSIYFFGRSHEHNLLNISASLLFCLFLCIDQMTAVDNPAWARKLLPVSPWLAVAAFGIAYSGGLASKVPVQLATLTRHTPLPASDDAGVINCSEIGPGKVFVYSAYEYWFYERCQYIPQGYVQPFLLQPMQDKAVAQLDGLLNSGYRIVVPKAKLWKEVPGEYSYNQFAFDEMESRLSGMDRSETEHYKIYWRPHPGLAVLQ